VAFFNLALAGFVIASIAVRFVFPALSLEGRTFWVLKSAPLPLRRWWWSKFWVSLLPLLFFGELLVSVNFTAEHSAKIAASFGGVLYMVLCISFIGIVTVLEAWPVYVIFMSKLQQSPLSPAIWSGIVTSFGLAFTLVLGVFWFSMRWSIARVEAMEISL
jgi:ABC-2 type transport system permease protein